MPLAGAPTDNNLNRSTKVANKIFSKVMLLNKNFQINYDWEEVHAYIYE